MSSAVCGKFAMKSCSLPFLIDVKRVFDADPDPFFRQIDAGLNGEDGAGSKWFRGVQGDRERRYQLNGLNPWMKYLSSGWPCRSLPCVLM